MANGTPMDPTSVARRIALARRIGSEMSAASKRRKAMDASAAFYRSQGLAAEANKTAGAGKAAFDETKKRLVGQLKDAGM